MGREWPWYRGFTGRWQIQDAKARFSELMERARTEGPQTITGHGTECAVVLSVEDYSESASCKPSFKAYLLGGPKVDDFHVPRSRDTGRVIKLRWRKN